MTKDEQEVIRLKDGLTYLMKQWKKKCGRPGGASVQQQEANTRADQARKECIKDVELLLKDRCTNRRCASYTGKVNDSYCKDCRRAQRHCCGLQGFDPMQGDVCEGCEVEKQERENKET